MRTHVQVLGWIFLIYSGFFLLMGLLGLLAFLGFGALAGFAGSLSAIPIIGGLGIVLFLFILAVCLPGLMAGIGLLTYAPWARVLAIILAVLNLFNFPVGTALAVYALYVLFHEETVRLFRA